MNNCRVPIPLLLILLTLIAFAGCTSAPQPGIPATPAPATVAITTPSPAVSLTATPEPTVNATQTPVPTTIPQVSATTTWIPKTYGRDAMSDPRIISLTFVKEAFGYEVPNCGMQSAFPAIAGDPAYGIYQPQPRLAMISEDEMREFILANVDDRHMTDPNPERYVNANLAGGAACSGVIANPTWSFVQLNATLMPRNARPGMYDIGINVRSKGEIIEQIRLNRSFELDKAVIIAGYVPLHSAETDAFDSVEMVFARQNGTG